MNNCCLAVEGDLFEYLAELKGIRLSEVLKHTVVYARSNPHQKQRIVRAIKAALASAK